MAQLITLLSIFLFTFSSQAFAKDETCMEVTLTGTLGGPDVYEGLAGAGTLVKFGTISNGCSDLHLQFDTGRSTVIRLAELNIHPNMIDAFFLLTFTPIIRLGSSTWRKLAGILLLKNWIWFVVMTLKKMGHLLV